MGYPDCSSCVSEKGCAFTFGRLHDKCVQVKADDCSRGMLNCKNPKDTSTCKDPDQKFCAVTDLSKGAGAADNARFQLGTCAWLKGMRRESKKFCRSKETCAQCQDDRIRMNNQMQIQRFEYYGCGWFDGKCKSPREG